MRRVVLGFLVLVLVIAAVVLWWDRGPTVERTATLPDIELATFQDEHLHKSIKDDRGVLLGGVGSGLFSLGHHEYWTITDRGPNGEPAEDVRSFIVPEFTPTLVKIRLSGTSAKVLASLPLTT